MRKTGALFQLWVSCVLLPCLYSDNVLALDPADGPSSEANARIRQVVFRIYTQNAKDPSAYTTARGRVMNRSIKLPEQIPAQAKLALLGSDQTDADVRQALQNWIVVGLADSRWPALNLRESSAAPWVRIMDALGLPLKGKGAQLSILWHPTQPFRLADGRAMPKDLLSIDLTDLRTDELGNVLVPWVMKASNRTRPRARPLSWPAWDLRFLTAKVDIVFQHPDYGRAMISAPSPGGDEDAVRVCLVKAGTVEASRAVTGRVVDRDNNTPIPNAVISCRTIRTPGEGLIKVHPAKVLTDQQGRFRYYPVCLENRTDERGSLVPPHSRYALSVYAPEHPEFLPEPVSVYNDAPAVIEMRRGDAFHRFAFESQAKTQTSSPQTPVTVYYTQPGAAQARYGLPQSYLEQGGVIPWGTYHARFGRVPNTRAFAPLEVTEDSPELLVFKPLAGHIYEGRLVHGVDEQPLEGFVLAFSGHRSGAQMGDLSAQDWELIGQFDTDAATTSAVLARLSQIYTIEAMVRTQANGTYRLALEPGLKTHSLLFFARDYVPFTVPVHQYAHQPGLPAQVPDVRLYPAAYVTVTPRVSVANDGHVSVMPRWLIDPDNNPSWALDMIPWVNWRYQNQGQFVYDAWLTLDRPNRIYIPAGLNLKLRLNTPYDKELCSLTIPTPVALSQAQQTDLGEWDLPQAQAFVVNVTDLQGQALEGWPLRKRAGKKGWGVAHNTDEFGAAYFYAPPHARVEVRIGLHDLKLGTDEALQEQLSWSFDLGGSIDEIPMFEISIPTELVERFQENIKE